MKAKKNISSVSETISQSFILLIKLLVVFIVFSLVFFGWVNTYKTYIKSENTDQRIEAIEKKIEKLSFSIPESRMKAVAIAIYSNSKVNGVNPDDVIAICYVESGFDAKAINRASGDYGIAQVNWGWWGSKFVKSPRELLDINKNIEVACKIIKHNKNNGFDDVSYYHNLYDNEKRTIYKAKIDRAKNKIRNI